MNKKIISMTIAVRGNQFCGHYTNTASEYTKWSCTVHVDDDGGVDKITNLKFLTGLNRNEINMRLKERTKEFFALNDPFGSIPEYLI